MYAQRRFQTRPQRVPVHGRWNSALLFRLIATEDTSKKTKQKPRRDKDAKCSFIIIQNFLKYDDKFDPWIRYCQSDKR